MLLATLLREYVSPIAKLHYLALLQRLGVGTTEIPVASDSEEV